MGEPGREFGLAALATRNFLLEGMMIQFNSIQFNSILYYLCAESTATRPITDTAQMMMMMMIIIIILYLCYWSNIFAPPYVLMAWSLIK
jgi:hypothetical protein